MSGGAYPSPVILHAWRHPRATGAQGRCIGRCDLPVDPRRARRLARRIAAHAARHALPRVVLTSPLRRSREVGHWLARLGFVHRVDASLAELDFGDWDGLRWDAIARSELERWTTDFVHHRPGGGESVADLLARVAAFVPGEARILVGHGGWLSAARWLRECPGQAPTAATWPAPPRHGAREPLGL